MASVGKEQTGYFHNWESGNYNTNASEWNEDEYKVLSPQNTSSPFFGRAVEHVTRLAVSKDMWVDWLFSGVLAATSPARCAVARR